MMEGCQSRSPPFFYFPLLYLHCHSCFRIGGGGGEGCEVRKGRGKGNTTRCGRSENLLGKELLQITGGLSLLFSPPDDSLWGACGELLLNSLEKKNSGLGKLEVKKVN